MANNVFPDILPVKFGDSPSLDAFAKLRVSSPETIFDSKQIFDNQPLFWDDQEVSGSGTTSVHSTNKASTVMGVAATTAGKRIRQTFMRFNYQSGKSQLPTASGTFDLSGGGTGIIRSIGYYDDNNGIFYSDIEGTMNVVIRSFTSGSAVDNPIPQDEWNIDKLDGSGDEETNPSGLTLDLTKSQIVYPDFEWLSAGRVRIAYFIGGMPIPIHEFKHANELEGPYMSTPNLPLRYEIENTGAGVASTMRHICGSVMSEGGNQDTGVLKYLSTGNSFLNANTTGVIYAVLGMRLKSTHLAATIKLVDVSLVEFQGNKFYEWFFAFNPTVAGTFTYLNEDNSALQAVIGTVANIVTLVSDSDAFGGGMTSSAQKGGSSVSKALETARRLGSKIDGTPDEIVLCVRPIGGSASLDIAATITARELQ